MSISVAFSRLFSVARLPHESLRGPKIRRNEIPELLREGVTNENGNKITI